MSSEFSADRSDAIRAMLVDAAVPTHRARRVLTAAALVTGGLVVGVAVSAAAFAISPQPGVATVFSLDSGIPAPAGVIPGQPIVSMLGDLVTQSTNGNVTLELNTAPTGATHVRVSVTCLTAGTISWGPDASGNNPALACTETDLGTPTSGYLDFPLFATLHITADAAIDAVVSYQFFSYIETAWGVNARGETFGAQKGEAMPDLVAVSGGYARASDLQAFGPDWPELPSNPEEALAWQAERDATYPDGWDIPVYDSDGVTQTGTFHIG